MSPYVDRATAERRAGLPLPSGKRSRTLGALAICAFAYLYPFPYQPEVNNPNENVRFYMTAAIAEDGTYAIDDMRARWGWTNDAATFGGHFFSVKAPGASLLGVPGYFVYYRICRALGHEVDRTTALWVVRVTGSILPALLFLWFFHRWLSRRGGSPVARDAVFMSVAIGSLYYGYGMMFVSHTQSAAVAFASFALLYDARHRGFLSGWQAFAAGFCAASITALEYPGFVQTVVLCFYALFALRPRKRLWAFAGGALIPTLAVLHFHWRAFGNPLTPGHRYLETTPFREAMEEGFFGASTFSPDAAGNLLFAPAYGLFTITPLLFFGVVGFLVLAAHRRTRVDGVAALLVCASLYLLICFMNNWRGGWTIGARYLASCVPFLAWGAIEALKPLTRAWQRTVEAGALGALSTALLASGGVAAWYPHLPEAFTKPIPQLLRVLVRHDFAPMNAGSYLADHFGVGHLYGTASMVPLAIAALVAIFWAAWPERTSWDRAAILVGSTFVSSWLLMPLVVDTPTPGVGASVAYVTMHWTPEGHDLPSRLEARVADGVATDAELERLRDVYAEEGREAEARRTERRLLNRRAAPRP